MSTKVSELTSLGSAPADTDVIPVVDVSDTSQAASGTLKKLAASYLAKTDGTAATITGGGTVALGGYTLTVGATGTASLSGHTHTESDITDLGSYLTTVAINDVSDIVITTPADNEVLAYDSGGNWINQTPAEAGLAEATHTHTESDITDLGSYLTTVALNDVSDVTIDTPADNEVLAWNGTDTWINQTAAEAGLAAASHTHGVSDITDIASNYEAALGNPASDGYVLSSTAGGTRSWIEAGGGAAAETRFTIGTQLDSTVTTTSYTAYAFTSSFAITADMIPSGKSVYFAAIMKAASGETVYAELSGVTGSEISTTATSYTYVVSASAITLTPGTVYYVQLKSSAGGSSNSVGSVYIVFK